MHKLTEKEINVGLARHLCLLEHEEIVTRFIDRGLFIQSRRQLRKYFMISPSHPFTRKYVRSQRQIRKQEMFHLVEHYNMIHPFSKFCLHWSYVMAFTLMMFWLVIPIYVGTPISEMGDTRWIMLALQSIHIANILVSFCVGYHVASKSKIILTPWKVSQHYLQTYFLVEFCSCVPVILTFRRVFRYPSAGMYQRLDYLVYTKLFLVPMWLHDVKIIQLSKGINDYVINLFKILLAFICCILWTYTIIWHTSGYGRWESWNLYLEHMEKATALLMLAGPRLVDRADLLQSTTIFTMFLGFIFQLLLFVGVSMVWKKYSSVSARQDAFYKEVDAFMIYNALPESKRERIKTYYSFKYQGNYYKEKAIETIISDRLRQDVMQYVSAANMANVDLLINLPKDILVEFSKFLETETYLAGDVIVRSGTMGDAMYFILVGTVGVAMPNGKIVAILKDGMNFGEISLILQVARIATVIALKPCEILRLNRTNFVNAFSRCKSSLEMLKEIARERLAYAQIFPRLSTGATTLESAIIDPEIMHHKEIEEIAIPSRRLTRTEEDILNAASTVSVPVPDSLSSESAVDSEDEDQPDRARIARIRSSPRDEF